MTDKEFATEKRRFKKVADKWKTTLGLGAHKLSIIYDRHTKEEARDVAVDCSNSWQYRLISLTVYTPVTQENDEEELEHIVVHELAHSLIAPLAQNRDDDTDQLHEFATECVAQAILW